MLGSRVRTQVGRARQKFPQSEPWESPETGTHACVTAPEFAKRWGKVHRSERLVPHHREAVAVMATASRPFQGLLWETQSLVIGSALHNPTGVQ